MKQNLLDKKFGRLTVISFSHKNNKNVPHWLCHCECGNVVIVNGYSLLKGKTKSCGCNRGGRYDLSGRKFGKLTVIKSTGKTKWHSVIWECLCDCGNTINIPSRNLLTNNTTSCGCNFKLPIGIAAFNRLLFSYKKSAEKRGYKFKLSDSEFYELTQQNCYYCNKEPSQIYEIPGANGNFIYNGIDRIDNELGYDLNNCVSCCKWCNRAKDTMSYDEFLNHILKIYEHRIKNAI